MENLNYCRVCGRNNENEEEFTCLVKEDNELTDTGIMYEELLNVQIKEEEIQAGIIKLCNSCQLQMKLFKDLKERAVKTLNFLQKKFMQTTDEILNEIMLENDEENHIEEEENYEISEPMYENTYKVECVQDTDIAKEETKKRRRISKEYFCNYCNINFAKRHEYQQHRLEVHQNKYPCVVCDKQLNTSHSLRIHERLHGAEGSFKCNLCEKSFNQKVHFVNHMNMHNNVREFHCEECGKSFSNKSNLSIHIRTHTGDKRYSCEVCGKSFLLSTHLKAHSYTHTGERTFQCDICQEFFISPRTLSVHKYHLHNDIKRTYECNICGKIFTRTNVLKTHYRTHKKVQKVQQQSSENDERLAEEDFDDMDSCRDFITYSPELKEIDSPSEYLII